MAEECTDHQGSVAITSSSTPLMIMNWWDHLPPPGSWSNISNPSSNWHQLHPIMNPNCHDDDQDDHLSISTSFNSHTPNSNHSGLAVESAPRRGILLNHVEPAVSSNQNLIESSEHASDHHSQLWSHVLSSIENNSSDQLHNDEDVAGENFLDALSSKSNNMIMSRGSHLFDQVQPACDYLKKLDMNMTSTYNDDWDHDHHYPIIQSQLVDNRPGFNFNPDQLACNPNTNNNISTINSISSSSIDNESYSRTNDDHDYYGALNMNRDPHETTSDSYTSTGPRNFAHHDFISFNALLSKPLIDTTISHAAKPASFLKSLNLSDHHGKKQHRGANSSPTRASTGRGNASNHGKKKRYEDMTASETVLIKKTKQETATAAAASANKTLQQPKVKLGDRITKLQQIVSPFGKTDTASVLLEAIGYIKFLQEQVELLSNPYMMKTNSLKDTWGCSEKKERGGGHHSTTLDLKSRGLCLVPVSCTPQVYRDNNGSDYLSPTYRGCFYRS